MMPALLLSLLIPFSQVAADRLQKLNIPPLPSYTLTMGEVYHYPKEKTIKRPSKLTLREVRP